MNRTTVRSHCLSLWINVNLIHGEADSSSNHQLVPVSGSYGWVLEFCHSPEGGEEVLYPAVQTCEGLPRSNLQETKARNQYESFGQRRGSLKLQVKI